MYEHRNVNTKEHPGAVYLWTGFIWLRTGAGAESSEHGNDPSGYKEATNLDGCMKEKEKRRMVGRMEQKYEGKHSEEMFLL
jgi:hypothetical protein